jgi:large subunit ribosomal protein L13
MQKTWNAKPGEVQQRWYVVDAEGQTLGRLATRIADILRGKTKAEYTPHVDTGDFVVVVNAEKIHVTGKKLDDKIYYRHSGYPGGLKQRTLREQLDRRPSRAEVETSSRFLGAVAHGRRIVAVGRLAEEATGAPYVRHPSHGGATAFRRDLEALLVRFRAGARPCAAFP